MCEILFIAFLARKAGAIAENKGYSSILFGSLFVLVWVGAEALGFVVAQARMPIEQTGIARVYVFAIFLAVLTCPLTFIVLLFLPEQGANPSGTRRQARRRPPRRRRWEDDEDEPRRRRRAEDDEEPPQPRMREHREEDEPPPRRRVMDEPRRRRRSYDD